VVISRVAKVTLPTTAMPNYRESWHFQTKSASPMHTSGSVDLTLSGDCSIRFLSVVIILANVGVMELVSIRSADIVH